MEGGPQRWDVDRHHSAPRPPLALSRDAPPARCCAMFTELPVACAPCAAAPARPPRSAAAGRVQRRRGRGARGPRRRPAACADTCAGCVVPASRLRCTYRGRRAACPRCSPCAPSSLGKEVPPRNAWPYHDRAGAGLNARLNDWADFEEAAAPPPAPTPGAGVSSKRAASGKPIAHPSSPP